MSVKNVYAVVMAGGRGERFWPQSRASHPKQLLRLIGNLTMIEQTVERLHPLIENENILIFTNSDYVAPMRTLLPALPPENIVAEPFGRDTGPCIAAAAGLIRQRAGNDDAVMLVLTSDHIIHDAASMRQVLSDCAEVAESSGKAVTIGVNPSCASTGYGYIKCGEKLPYELSTPFYQGLGFKEKPNSEMADKLFSAGDYKWNSGIFIWTIRTIRGLLKNFAPKLSAVADAIAASTPETFDEVLRNGYQRCEKISIDYAVMEKVPNEQIVIAGCSFDWDDVGSWNALRNQGTPDQDNNIIRGLFEGVDVHDCIIVSDNRHLVTAIDVNDLIIVHTDDATLVCRSKSAQRIKELVQNMAKNPELTKFL